MPMSIMFFYREDVYKYKNRPNAAPQRDSAEIIIGKQRNGPVGVAELAPRFALHIFANMAPDWMPELLPEQAAIK